MLQLVINILLIVLLGAGVFFVVLLIRKELEKTKQPKEPVELTQVHYTVDGEAKVTNPELKAKAELAEIIEEFDSIKPDDSPEYKKIKLAAITQRLVKLKSQLKGQK